MARYLLYLLGHVSGQNEFVYVIINSGRITVKEDVEPVDADYLNRNFKNGNQGELYRVDDDWWMSDHWSQANRDASWDLFNTDQLGLFRHSWMKRSKEEEDDYSNFIQFIKLINRRDYTKEEVESFLDPEAMLKMTAVMGFIADWDTFTQARGKNAYLYQRPDDRKFQLLHWDADLAFGQRRHNSFYGGSWQFKEWVEKDYNFPQFVKYLEQLVTLTTNPQGRVEAWMREESRGNPDTRINSNFYRNFFQDRSRQVDQLD
jgi:spore coat protein CotH